MMKRRLAIRDRLAWLVALLALGVVAYVFLPLWVVVAAVVLLLGVPLLLRRSGRSRSRR
jgi:hypothetical protein